MTRFKLFRSFVFIAAAVVCAGALAAKAVELEAFYEAFFEAGLEHNPLRATFIGDHRWSDRWPNSLSAEYREAELAFHREYLKRLRAFGPEGLSGQDLISYRIFERERERAIEGARFPDHLVPLNQFRNSVNFLVMLGSGTSAQPFRNADDFHAFYHRATEFVTYLDQAIANMRDGMEAGVVPPRILMERVLDQIDAHIVADPEDSELYRPVKDMPEEIEEADRERRLEDTHLHS